MQAPHQSEQNVRPSPPERLPATRLDSAAVVEKPSKGKGQKGAKGPDPWPLQWQKGESEWQQPWSAAPKSSGGGSKNARQQQRQGRRQGKSENKQWDEPKPPSGNEAWNQLWQETAQWDSMRERGDTDRGENMRQQEEKELQQQLQLQLGLLEESIEASKAIKGTSKAKHLPLGGTHHEPRGDLHTGSSSSSVSAGKDLLHQDSSGQGLSNMSRLRRNKWINRQVTRIADTGNLQRLLQTIQFHIAEMNGINLATALHRVTKLVVNSISGISTQQLLRHPSFQLLRATVVQHIDMHRLKKPGSPDADEAHEPVFEVQCMSIVCWSCATLRLHEEKLLETIADIVLPCLGELKPFELSNMLWAYAKLSLGKPALLNAVSERMLNREWGEFSMQCLSMIAWSFATEKHRDLPVFSSIACEIVANAATTRPQEIANTLWAYAKNRCAEVSLFNALAEAAISHNMLWSFKSQELSNTVWAFATIGLQHQLLFKNAVTVAISKRRELSPQNIANILWAYAKLQVCRNSGLFPALLSVSVGMMPQHKPHEISAIVWAAAKAEVKLDVEENYPACRRFFNATAHMCRQRLHEFPPQALANMVEAFAIIEADFPSFSEAMARESVGRLHQFDPMALANLFRGVVLVARRQHNAGMPEHDRNLAVLAAIGAHVALRIGELQPGDVAHVEHSLQLLGPSMRAASTGGLDQRVLKAMIGRSDSKKDNRHHGAHGGAYRKKMNADAVLDDFADNNPEEISESVAEDDDRPTAELLLGDFANDLDDLVNEDDDNLENEFTEDHRENWRPQRPYSMWGPPGSKSYGKGTPAWRKGGGAASFGDSGYYDWSGGGKGGCGRRGGGGPAEAAMQPWMMEAPAWNPWSQGFSAPPGAFIPRPSPSAGAPGLEPLGGPPYEEALGTLMSPMQVGWQGGSAFDEFGAHPHSQGLPFRGSQQSPWMSSSGPTPWWEDGVSGSDPLWYNKQSLWPAPEDSESWQQGPAATTSPSATSAGHTSLAPQESLAPPKPDAPPAGQSWKPRDVPVSCFVQMLSDADKETGSLATRWGPVELEDNAVLVGAGENVVRLRYGVTDERVVLKRTAACEAQMLGPVAACANVLSPIGLLKGEEALCYLAYPHCQHGTLAEWIIDQRLLSRPPRAAEIVDIVCGILRAASIFVTTGAGLSSLRADEIFLDSEMKPRVRIRHTRTCGKWLAPQDPQVTSMPPGADAWPLAVYKLGLILYCLGAQTPDPYPQKTAEMVLEDLRQEASGDGPSVRPDFSTFNGPKPLRELTEKCLSPEAFDCPDQATLTATLQNMNKRIAQNHQ
mmetsp:Transcript_122928/g.236999  ORF Transcript_122928/g.236999 Transcript_122928/m.236999 type:complete len:1309 (+) Transcript_122928:109-4035(+)